jgi:tetratricopeptide (TPR) repeat protein
MNCPPRLHKRVACTLLAFLLPALVPGCEKKPVDPARQARRTELSAPATTQVAPVQPNTTGSALPEATRFWAKPDTVPTTFPADLPENPDIPKPLFPGIAEKYNREIINAYVAAVKSPDDAEKIGELGMLFHRLTSVTEATKCFERALSLDPKSLRWRYYLAISHESAFDMPAAIKTLNEALAIDPNYPGLHLRMGDLTRATDVKSARESYSRALRLSPNDARIRYGIAQCELLEGKVDAAVEYLQHAVSLAPRYADAHKELANYFVKKGEKKKADVHQALADQGGLPPVVADPLYLDLISRLVGPEATLSLTKQLVETGQADQAIEILKRNLKVEPSEWLLHQQLGVALMDRGRIAEAAAEFQLVLDEDPGQPRIRSYLAKALIDLGRYQEAEELLKSAIKLAPNDNESLARYAEMLLMTGHGKEAEEIYGRLIRSEPNNPINHLGLVISQLCEKKIAQAARNFNAVQSGLRAGRDLTGILVAQWAMALGEQRLADPTNYRKAVLTEADLEAFGDQLADLGRPDEARAVRNYRDTIARNAVAMAETGNFSQAVRLMQRAICMDEGGVLRDAFRTGYLTVRKMSPAAADRFVRDAAASAASLPSLANAVAWILATCPEASQRDGQTALSLAKGACEATNQANPEYLDTLAAAYAEVGQFDEAARVAQQAIQIASARNATRAVEKYRERLALYEARKPFHAAS